MASTGTKDFIASGNLDIRHGEATNASLVTIQGIDTGWSGTVIVQAAARGTTNYVPITYKRRSLIAAASDDTIVSTTITDIAFLIAIDSAGLDIRIVVTVTAGTLTLNWASVNG